MQTPSPRSRCPLPSASGSSFPSQALTSPASTRAQRPLMVPMAAARGQHGCLQGREIGQQRDRHVVGTGPRPTSSPALGHCQQSHQHGADADPAQPRLGQVSGVSVAPPPTAGSPLCSASRASPSIPAFTSSAQPRHPDLLQTSGTAEAEAPQSRTGCLSGGPLAGKVSLPPVLSPAPVWMPGCPGALQVTPTWPPSCLLPATRQGRAAGSRSRAL